MTMDSIEIPYEQEQVNPNRGNPQSPDRTKQLLPTEGFETPDRRTIGTNNNNDDEQDKLQPVVEPIEVFETPDRTIGTTGTDSLMGSPNAAVSDLGQEVDEMINVVKNYVQAPQGYSPTRHEFESTMQAIQEMEKLEEASVLRRELESLQEEEPNSFMENIFGAFVMSPSPAVSRQTSTVSGVPSSTASASASASQRGTVVHEMLKRLVVQELQSRRDKSATVIQSTVRRVQAQKKKQEMRVIATERKRALHELAMLKRYAQYGSLGSRKTVTFNDKEEVAGEIKTSKLSKMKTALKRIKKKKKKKNNVSSSVSKAPLLPHIPEESSSSAPPPQEEGEGQEVDFDDLPVQENGADHKSSKWWKTVKKLKVKKLVTKLNKMKQQRSRQRGVISPPFDGVVEEQQQEEPVYEPPPRLMTLIITTTDDSIPSPEAEAEANEYQNHREQKQREAAAAAAAAEAAESETAARSAVTPSAAETPLYEGAEEEESVTRSHFSMTSSLPSGRDLGWTSNFVLADDATSITSARSGPLLDSWFRPFLFNEEILNEMDDDAIEEIVEQVFTNKNLQKDLSILPEMDWTDQDWAEAKLSLLRCSRDHVDEITYQTNRFVSNEVTL